MDPVPSPDSREPGAEDSSDLSLSAQGDSSSNRRFNDSDIDRLLRTARELTGQTTDDVDPVAVPAAAADMPRADSVDLQESRVEKEAQPEEAAPSPQRPGEVQSKVAATEWLHMNRRLTQNGFPAVEMDQLFQNTTAARDISGVVMQVMVAYERKCEAMEDLVVNDGVARQKERISSQQIELLENKNTELERIVGAMQNKEKTLAENLKSTQRQLTEETSRLSAQLSGLKQKCVAEEHRCRAKEATIQKLQERIGSLVDKDSSEREKHKELFKKIHARNPRPSSPKDRESLDFIEMYETQKRNMEDEIKHLARELRKANRTIAELENHSIVKTSPSKVSGEEIREELYEAKQELKMQQAKLKNQEADMVSRLQEMGREHSAAVQRVAELEDEVANLTMELQSRPSIREYKDLERKAGTLEKRLGMKDHDGQMRAKLSTREQIARDRDIYRLNLTEIDDLSHESACDMLKDVCRQLQVSEPQHITMSLAKLVKVVSAVPNMERFIRDVLDVVLGANNPHATPSDVVPTLVNWASELDELSDLRDFRLAVQGQVAKRQKMLDDPRKDKLSTTDLVMQVRDLVTAEATVLQASEAFAAADVEVKNKPEVLINKILAHFQNLFNVKSTEGILPKLNELYLTTNEQSNFMKAMRSILGLDASAGVNAILAQVRRALDSDARQMHFAAGVLDQDMKALNSQPPMSRKEMGQLDRYMQVTSELMNLFEVSQVERLPGESRKVLKKLENLQSTLPALQGLANTLVRTLKVNTIDDIIPAVRNLSGATKRAKAGVAARGM